MTTSISDKKWYVVRAVSGQESKIKDHIKSEISRFGFDNQVEDLLVPTEKVIQIRNGKKINCESDGGVIASSNKYLHKEVLNIIGN